MTMETITDNVFHEYTVKRADPTPDGWTVHFVEGFAIHVPSRRESTAPAPGETIRCYGKGFGYEVHGITVGGRVYRYQSAEAYRAEFLRSLQRPAPVDDVTAAVAAERARCAAVCREVAAGYDGHAGAVARQCAEAIERGADERRFHLQLADGCGGWVPASEHGTPDLYATARDAWDVARTLYPDTEHLSQMCRVVERGAVAR